MPRGGRRDGAGRKPNGTNGNGHIVLIPQTPQREVVDIAKYVRERVGNKPIDALLDVLDDEAAKPGELVAAASQLLDRGWGKARQTVDTNEVRELIVTVRRRHE